MSETPREKEIQKQLFAELRTKTHEQVDRETRERIEKDPVPTELELQMGTFKEQLEPQVRDAVMEFYRRGYSCQSSGFHGQDHEKQLLVGHFQLDEQTRQKISLAGAQLSNVEKFNNTMISFEADTLDINAIKRKWDAIAAILPDRKTTGQPSFSKGAVEFRTRYSPERLDVNVSALTWGMKSEDMPPEGKQILTERLEQLLKSQNPDQ